MKKYLLLWFLLTTTALQTALASRFGALLFILGKILRLGFFIFFLAVLGSRTRLIGGYTLTQMIFFFLTYNVIDSVSQFFLREVYRFRNYVVRGDFDYFLVKPMSPLFRSLFGGSDILDLPVIIILLVLTYITAVHLGSISLVNVALYILLVINGLVIVTSLHIGILCLGILTTEVDNAIWLYRDFTQMARIPVDIYREPVRSILFFAIPIGIMITFPAKVLFGLFSFSLFVYSMLFGVVIFAASLWLWKYAIKQYASASS